jgi:hypothetical protein
MATPEYNSVNRTAQKKEKSVLFQHDEAYLPPGLSIVSPVREEQFVVAADAHVGHLYP